jgi:hypothetical protein
VVANVAVGRSSGPPRFTLFCTSKSVKSGHDDAGGSVPEMLLKLNDKTRTLANVEGSTPVKRLFDIDKVCKFVIFEPHAGGIVLVSRLSSSATFVAVAPQLAYAAGIVPLIKFDRIWNFVMFFHIEY